MAVVCMLIKYMSLLIDVKLFFVTIFFWYYFDPKTIDLENQIIFHMGNDYFYYLKASELGKLLTKIKMFKYSYNSGEMGTFFQP